MGAQETQLASRNTTKVAQSPKERGIDVVLWIKKSAQEIIWLSITPGKVPNEAQISLEPDQPKADLADSHNRNAC